MLRYCPIQKIKFKRGKLSKKLIDDLYVNRNGSPINPSTILSDRDPYYELKKDAKFTEEGKNLGTFSVYKERIKEGWYNLSEMNCDITDEESKQRAMKQLAAQKKCGIEDCAINMADFLNLDFVSRTIDFVNLDKREVFLYSYDTTNYKYLQFENKRDTYISNVSSRIEDADNGSIPIMIHFQIDKPDVYNKYLLLNSIFFYSKDKVYYQVPKEETASQNESHKKILDYKKNILNQKMLLFEKLKGKELLSDIAGLALISEDKLPDVKKKIDLIPKQYSNCVQIKKQNYTIYLTDLIDTIIEGSQLDQKNMNFKERCEEIKDNRIAKLMQFIDLNVDKLKKSE